MSSTVQITDNSMWLSHINSAEIANELSGLAPEEEVTLEIDGITGRWKRMKTGSNGLKTTGFKPIGPIKDVWNKWYRTEKGKLVSIRLVKTVDEHLAASSLLFSEWLSDEDEEAFRDL